MIGEGEDMIQDKDGDKKQIEWKRHKILAMERFTKNQFSWIIKGLKPSSLYYVRMRAQNNSGWGFYNNPPMEVRTKKSGLNSKILTEKERSQVLHWLGKEAHGNLKLLFRASKNGFKAAAFHTKCDNQGPTVTIVQSTKGNVFGGYSSISWSGTTANYVTDNNSFIFLVRSSRKIKAKYKCKTPGYAVYHNSVYGPVFGGGFDFCLYDNCNAVNSSYANAGHTYDCQSDQTLLAGEYNFTVKEYEVFKVK